MRGFFRLLLASIVGVSVGICARKMYGAKPEPLPLKPEAVIAVQAERTPIAASAGLSGPDNSSPYPTGYLKRNGRVIVAMSDGTTRIYQLGGQVDPELTVVHTNSATIDGRKMFYRPSPRKDSQRLHTSESSPLASTPAPSFAVIPPLVRP